MGSFSIRADDLRRLANRCIYLCDGHVIYLKGESPE